jgi:nucleoside-diphosphate-sugar epimerase
MKSALVTGAAGFLGSHLCEYLVSNGFFVVAVDNFCTGQRQHRQILESWGEAIHFVEADITKSWEDWLRWVPSSFIQDLKYVFHLASPASPPFYQKLSLETLWANSIGLSNCIKFANENRAKVIFASTSEVYGDPLISPQPESYWGNVNPYGVRSCYDEAKRFGEALIFSENHRHGSRHGIVRIFNTYGPRMSYGDGRVVINFLTQALSGKKMSVYGDGLQRRSFTYVADTVRGIWKYAESGFSGPVNLGNDTDCSILELVHLIQRLVPENQGFEFFTGLQDDPRQRRPDITKAKTELSWYPEVSLEEGLRAMIQWMKECEYKES